QLMGPNGELDLGNLSHIFVSPAHMRILLGKLPAGFLPKANLTMSIGGGVVPPALANETRARLCPNLEVVYGSTELGLVVFCPRDLLLKVPDLTGVVLPFVKIEIVDDNGVSVPP